MEFRYLRAKSHARPGAEPESILEHTLAVMESAEAIVEATGRNQLIAFGLDPDRWIGRLRKDIQLAAFIHDIGKISDHFQGMIWGTRSHPQVIRHEAVSYWIATQTAIREWIDGAFEETDSADLVFWAIAGHHRKFPPPGTAEGRSDLRVFLGHPDVRALLEAGSRIVGLGEPPVLADFTLSFIAGDNAISAFQDAQLDAQDLMDRLSDAERRYLALLKACLIGADVAGSIGRSGGRTMAAWIGEAFARVPSQGQLDGIVTRKLGGRSLSQVLDGDDSHVASQRSVGERTDQRADTEAEFHRHRAAFQRAVGERTERVVFVRGGCGSGKTVAAYHWAGRLAERDQRLRRLFFCYPTMGTATEGYRDYLMDPELDATLVHGRAEVDMRFFGLGDNEPDAKPTARPKDEPNLAEDEPGRAEADSSRTLDLWSTPIVSCTVDTVLGLLQNHRKGVFAWPSIAGSAVVFDELHSYDDDLFAALLRFLADVRGVPSLLMTASLPADRLARIKETLARIGEPLGEVDGPERLETIERYRRDHAESPWDRVRQVMKERGKVLWIKNTVDAARDLFQSEEAQLAGAILYHSRYRYEDRVKRHRDVIDAFAPGRGAALAITTQVAEMSLDLSADLLITDLAPIPALIQRLGRLNRRATSDDPWPFLVEQPRSRKFPYNPVQLEEAETWLNELGDRPLSQRMLIKAWKPSPVPATSGDPSEAIWLDGGYITEPRPLRQSSPGIEIILKSDLADVVAKGKTSEEVRISMPPPSGKDWTSWDPIGFCKVPPDDQVEYDEIRGARWTR